MKKELAKLAASLATLSSLYITQTPTSTVTNYYAYSDTSNTEQAQRNKHFFSTPTQSCLWEL
jgi:hypothetical protein